jgi:crotonobetainyl-CoA:carnitine CoA-transferase CaiB-like acyl-CoA transferase
LTGITVLEFSQIYAGPFGGMLLADLGADVIKVEPTWGEPWRYTEEFAPGENRSFIALNRGKRGLPLDLATPEGRRIIHRLAETADVVVINARSDVPQALGIDYETLSAMNPGLVYCENTAFGQNGPESHRPGYDIIAQAVTGIMASEGRIEDGVPQQVQSTPLVDFVAAFTIALSVCSALYHRERTGRGQKIETSLMASALALQTSRFINIAAVDDERRTDFLTELERLRREGADYREIDDVYRSKLGPVRIGNIYYRTYQAADGALAVGCLSDSLRKKLLGVLELEDIRFDEGYDPTTEESLAFGGALVLKAEAIFRQRTVAEWVRALDEAGVPVGPVRFVEELMDDPQVLANNLVVDMEHAVAGALKMVGPLMKMSKTPLDLKRASPALGEHTDEILRSLGYSEAEVRDLKDRGVTR